MVIVYSREGCINCKITKNQLSKKGVEFDYKLLEDDDIPRLTEAVGVELKSLPIVTETHTDGEKLLWMGGLNVEGIRSLGERQVVLAS